MRIQLLLTLVFFLGIASCAQPQRELLGLEWQHTTVVSAPVPEIVAFYTSGSITTPEVLAEAESRRARLATYQEMFDFVATNVDELNGMRFVALGSFTIIEGVPYVLSMEVRGDNARLTLERMDSDWSEGLLFMMANLPDISETV